MPDTKVAPLSRSATHARAVKLKEHIVNCEWVLLGGCQGRLDVAHVDGNEFNGEPSNLLKLCRAHHRLMDKGKIDPKAPVMPSYTVDAGGKRRYEKAVTLAEGSPDEPTSDPADPAVLPAFTVETVPLSALSPHPRNYKAHPEDQLEHLRQSIREHGLYRNIIVAEDLTILAGHGVVEAARSLGISEVPVRRLPLDPEDPRAIKLLVGDNEVGHLGEVDDRALSEMLKEIAENDAAGLLGTGYDAAMLANLVFVTRPESEVPSVDAAAEWAGMPSYEDGTPPVQITLSFLTEEDRTACLAYLGITNVSKGKSAWWPPKDRDDPASLRFEA